MIPLFVQPLIAGGLNLLANAALAKGKEWIEKKTGVDISRGSLTNDEYLKLQQYELENEEALLKFKQENNRISAELEKAYLLDVQNARGMNVEAIKSDDKFVRRFIYYLAIFWSLFAATYVGAITFGKIPEENIRFADTVLGFLLGTVVASVLNFFFGSSKGSRDKTEMLEKGLNK
jgi:hypothetical protein